ncbi:ribbon-helix-helix domain-containing protein [Microcoleus sp. herbarium8]|uniref:ribbon-helix-helix domain-containing protein n=1 Tax=Microcoleus sp. herbarium8 TaxID=3055436 RepID=UPI0034DE8748
MLPSIRKLRCSFALSPELIQALNDYSASLEVSRSVFIEEALWIYRASSRPTLRIRHQKAISTRRSASSIRLPALLLLS